MSDKYMAIIKWNKQDVIEALEQGGYPGTEENIDEVFSEDTFLEEQSIAAGWEILESIVDGLDLPDKKW